MTICECVAAAVV